MPRGRPATQDQCLEYDRLRSRGISQAQAARKVGMSTNWGWKRDRHREFSPEVPDTPPSLTPVPYDQLTDDARRAWNDFEFFARRYLGHLYLPWQVEAAETIRDAYDSPDREYIVINVAPGAGKTTLLRDIAAWITVRDRTIRGLVGSHTEKVASAMLRRLRTVLETSVPIKAKTDEIEIGRAADAAAALSWDFGLFKPEDSVLWRANEFIISQPDGRVRDDKEPSWGCYGFDSGIIGMRYNFAIWDDPESTRKIANSDKVAADRQVWDGELEPRLEPGGLIVVVQQRLGPNDLSRHCLDKQVHAYDDDLDPDAPTDSTDPLDSVSVYRHIVYRAHDDANCKGREFHRTTSPPWPDGCLLDPLRLPWRDIRSKRDSSPHIYAVQYQQEDVHAPDVLIPEVWVKGGSDPETGEMLPGCLDATRTLLQPLPAGVLGEKVSLATVDPSGTNRWAVQWWVNVAGEVPMHFLMDLEHKSMEANDLLDWNAANQTFYGLIHDWTLRSIRMGLPITTWVVEINAAQRYLLAYDHVRRWTRQYGATITPHTTHRGNKATEEYGLTILREPHRHGRVVIPYAKTVDGSHLKVVNYVKELTRYPHVRYDDQVMATWFNHLHSPRHARRRDRGGTQWRPTWMRDTMSAAAGWAS